MVDKARNRRAKILAYDYTREETTANDHLAVFYLPIEVVWPTDFSLESREFPI